MNDPFYTIEQIESLRSKAILYCLETSERFRDFPAEYLQQYCNGCGPQRWSGKIRKAVTLPFARYEVCFAIHDVDYTPPHDCLRCEADRKLWRNMKKIWFRTYGWGGFLSHEGRLELAAIRILYKACRLGGLGAWNGDEA